MKNFFFYISLGCFINLPLYVLSEKTQVPFDDIVILIKENKFEEADRLLNDIINKSRGNHNAPVTGEALLYRAYIKYLQYDYSSANEIIDSSISILSKTKHKINYAKALNMKGNIISDDGEIKESLPFYQKSLAIKKSVGDTFEIAKSLNNIAIIYTDLSDYYNAITTHKEAIRLRWMIKDSVGLSTSMYNLGETFRYLSQYDSAVHYYNSSLKIASEINYEPTIANNYNGLSIVNYRQGLYTLAIKDLYKAEKLLRNSPMRSYYSYFLMNLGINYKELDEYDSAFKYFEKAKEEKKLANDQVGLAKTYNNMASMHLRMKKFNRAKLYIDSTYILLTDDPNPITLVNALLNDGSYHRHEGSYQLARSKIDSAINISMRIDYPEGASNGYYLKYLLDSSELKFPSAIIEIKRYYELKDSLLNSEKNDQIFKWRELFRSDQKDRTIKEQQASIALQKKNDKLKNYILVGILILFCSVITALWIIIRFNQRNKWLYKKNKMLLLEQQHRIKNNLQMVASILSLQSHNSSSDDVKSVFLEGHNRINSIALLNSMLAHDNHANQEILIEDYIRKIWNELKSMSTTNTQLQFIVDKDLLLPVETATSLGLIMNELFTNSIKHSINNKTNTVHVKLVSDMNRSYELTYQDNNVNFNKEEFEQSASLGRKLIYIQSSQLFGKYMIANCNGFHYVLNFKINNTQLEHVT